MNEPASKVGYYAHLSLSGSEGNDDFYFKTSKTPDEIGNLTKERANLKIIIINKG